MGIYGIDEETESQLSQLVASDVHEIKEITMKADCGDLLRGTVLEMVSTAASTWQQLATAANARAILAEDVTDSDSTQKAQAFFIGKYVETDLIWPAAITTANKKTAIVALQDRGILIDDAILDVSTTTTTTSSTTTTTTTTSSSSTTTTSTTTTTSSTTTTTTTTTTSP